jgi:DinB superfamily
VTAAVEGLVMRLADVERRLVEHAAAPLPPGLTDPDPGADERWEAGQVWAHLAEFPAYWLGQARGVMAPDAAEPVPFGRVKTDPGRVAAIENDRHTDPAGLLTRVRDALADVTDTARSLPDEAWQRRGVHPVLGEMPVERIFERFIAEHLEEHADQLDLLGDSPAVERR